MKRRPKGTHPIYWKASRRLPPEDWEKIPIADYAESFKGKLPSSLIDTPVDGAVPYLLIDNFVTGETTAYTTDTTLPMIADRDTAVVGDGSRSGLAVRGSTGVLGSTLVGFRAREGFDEDYLFYVLESLTPYTNTATIGGAVPHLDQRLLGTLRLATPPLDEQKKIAAVLVSADEAIDATKKEIEATERLKSSLMQQVFTKGIAGRYQRFQFVKKIGKIPYDWQALELRKLWSSVTNGLYMPSSSYGSGTHIIRIDTFEDGYFYTTDFKRVYIDESTRANFQIKNGDVLFNRVNSIPFIGKVVFVAGLMEYTVFESNMMRIRFGNEAVAKYVTLYLTSIKAKHRLWEMARPAVSQLSINQRELGLLTVPIPTKESEILEIIEIVESQRKHELALQEELKANQRLKQSLLQNLLTGRVRVGTGVAA